jgi:hypothetical protein
LTLKEAEELLYPDDRAEPEQATAVSKWRIILLSSISALQATAWAATGIFSVILALDPRNNNLRLLETFAVSISWIYSAFVIAFRSKPTPSYDLFTLWIINFVGGAFELGGTVFDWRAYGTPLPKSPIMFIIVLNMTVTFIMILTILRLPVAIPSKHVDPAKIVRFFCRTILHAYFMLHW